jgi:excisionase family DNA binding protein
MVSPYLTVQEVAELARCQHKAVRRAISQGALRAFRPTKRLLIRADDAEMWIESRVVAEAPSRGSRLNSATPAAGRKPGAGSVAALVEIEREAMRV